MKLRVVYMGAWLMLLPNFEASAKRTAKVSKAHKAGVVSKCSSGRTVRPLQRAKARGKKRKTEKYRHVAVVYDDGTLLSKQDINLCAVADAYYQDFADDRSFLFVFAQGEKDVADGYEAYYISVRNDVKGIGKELFDHSRRCGSKGGVLLGLANMNGTKKWRKFAFPGLDLWPLGVIVHELGHQWIAGLDKPVNGVRLTTEKGRTQGHWQPLVDTDASVMYGNNWRKLGQTRFLSTSLPRGFSNLDKYLMGALPASKVKPLFAIEAESSKIRTHYALPGNTAKGRKVTVSIGDIQNVFGDRVPQYGSAQTRFKAAFVLVVPEGQTVDKKALKVVNYFRKKIPKRLRRLTKKVFKFDTKVKSR